MTSRFQNCPWVSDLMKIWWRKRGKMTVAKWIISTVFIWIIIIITFIDHKIDLHGIEEFVWHTLSFDHDKIVKSGYLHKTLSSLISVSSTTEKIFQHHSIIFTTRFSKYFLPWQTISAESGSISKIPPKKLPIEE